MKLCGSGAHTNIVEVLRLGELIGSPYYFIDMELCSINLATYIYSETQVEGVPYFIKDAPPSVKLIQIWNIMRQVANGVEFIHSQKEVHRDIKPHNSNLPSVLC